MKKILLVAAILFFSLAVTASANHAPTNLVIVRSAAKTVTVGWSAVPGVTGYGLYRDGTRIATAGASATSAKFGTPEYRRYVLGVSALKTGGEMSTITVDPRWVVVSVNIPEEPNPPPPPPTVGITSGPSNPTTSTTATFAWSSTNATGFTCQIDSGSPAACSSPTTYSSLALGTHTFAVNGAGPGGVAQATASWTIQEDTPPPPPPPNNGLANVWIDANGGSCTRNSASVVYGDAAACGSFAAAYTAAQSGDRIGVTGSLGTQKFAGGFQSTQPRGTKTLTFFGTPGHKVRQIHFGSPNLTFDGIAVDGGRVAQTGAGLENGGEGFLFKNGSIGNILDEKGALVTEGVVGTSGSPIVFDNVRFHDVILRGDGVHLECMMALWADEMVIRNSRFENCAIMALSYGIADWWGSFPPPTDKVTLENNFFGKVKFDDEGCCAVYSLAIWSTQLPSGSNFGQLNGWRIVNNVVEAPSDTIVRPTLGTGNVICGNSGNVPTNWKNSC